MVNDTTAATATATATATQHCPRCDKDLPLDAYHPGKQGIRGHYCRDCANSYKRERYRPAPRAPRRIRLCATAGCPVQVVSGRARCNQHTRTHLEPSTTYGAVHLRVGKARGKAATHACVHCDAQADEWAYDHKDPAEITGPTSRGIVTTYSPDPDHYLPLCRSCHVRFDNGYGARLNGAHVEPKRVSKW